MLLYYRWEIGFFAQSSVVALGDRMETFMKSKLFSSLYSFNIIMQAIFSLVTPAGFLFLVAWLLINKAGAPEWIYAIAIPLGILIGLFSMIKFIFSATEALTRLEEQNEKKSKNKNTKE